MTKKNEESIVVKVKDGVSYIIKTNILNKAVKRVWFIKKGLC